MSDLKQKLLAGILVFAIFAPNLPSVLAATFEPYQQTFIISAYYSPCPDQVVYFRGSYDADRRLNGNGTNGADGTQVYPGMLAAPRSYAFGMKLAIPGLGVGTIHDRGGAIVDAGVRSNAYDRIDVWMGRCEEGLARALQWGKRTVTATVYPADYTIAESFELPGSSPRLVVDLKLGDTGNTVRLLQEELKTYGYYRGTLSGEFDELTEQALLGYQLARRIVSSADSAGAGTLGSATRESLNNEAFKRSWKIPSGLLTASVVHTSGTTNTTNSRFPTTLALGDRGDEVRELQIALTEIGAYDCEINGVYDENTEKCIFKFQVQQGILTDFEEQGAGITGPQTRAALTTALIAREKKLAALVADRLPSSTAQPGATGETVERLQAGLAKLGYYDEEVNGDYDKITQVALADFQIAAGIIESQTTYGAGWFGAKTKTAFDKELRGALLALPTLPKNPDWTRQVVIAYTPRFTTSLGLGDTGELVSELQETLIKLGYFADEATGNYGELTATAVIQFQLAVSVITSADDYGAGSFGPQTRAALNTTVSSEKIALERIETSS